MFKEGTKKNDARREMRTNQTEKSADGNKEHSEMEKGKHKKNMMKIRTKKTKGKQMPKTTAAGS